MSALPSIG